MAGERSQDKPPHVLAERKHRDTACAKTPAGSSEELPAIELSATDSRVFVRALLRPQPVNLRLQDTIRRYREHSDAARSMAVLRKK